MCAQMGEGRGGGAKSIRILVKEIILLSKNVHGGGGGGCVIFERTSNSLFIIGVALYYHLV